MAAPGRVPPLTLLADLSALAATWRHYAGLERADTNDPRNTTPEESKARASAWEGAADELDELVRRHAADGMAAESEPIEVTMEWTDVEPEPEPTGTAALVTEAFDVRRLAECRALVEHLAGKQHGLDADTLLAEDWDALMRLHNGRPHGRGRGKDHTADHGHVTARAAELYRAARKRERKAVAR